MTLTEVAPTPTQFAAQVAREYPRWRYAGGQVEGVLHYGVRLSVVAGLTTDPDAHVDGQGVYTCGVRGCVDCSREPLEADAAPAPAAEAPDWWHR